MRVVDADNCLLAEATGRIPVTEAGRADMPPARCGAACGRSRAKIQFGEHVMCSVLCKTGDAGRGSAAPERSPAGSGFPHCFVDIDAFVSEGKYAIPTWTFGLESRTYGLAVCEY